MQEISIVNLTNHYILLYPDEYTDIEIPVSKKDEEKFISRCIKIQEVGAAKAQLTRDGDAAQVAVKGYIGKRKVTLFYTHIGVVSGIPEPKENTIYVVSQLCYNAIHRIRKDVYIVDKPIRSVNGGIIGCRGFSRPVYDRDNLQLNAVEKYLKKRFSEVKAGLEADELSNCIILLNEYRRK